MKYIQILGMGEQLPLSVGNCISAGPNLVSLDPNSQIPITYIPPTDFNVNIWAHEANTAVGLISKKVSQQVQNSKKKNIAKKTTEKISDKISYDTVVLVTADGDDKCAGDDPSCGIEAKPMAYFMKDFLNVRKKKTA